MVEDVAGKLGRGCVVARRVSFGGRWGASVRVMANRRRFGG